MSTALLSSVGCGYEHTLERGLISHLGFRQVNGATAAVRQHSSNLRAFHLCDRIVKYQGEIRPSADESFKGLGSVEFDNPRLERIAQKLMAPIEAGFDTQFFECSEEEREAIFAEAVNVAFERIGSGVVPGSSKRISMLPSKSARKVVRRREKKGECLMRVHH